MKFQPVFIAGCDRSGTTMLGDILGSSGESFAAPESQWIHEYLLMQQAQAFASPADAACWLKAQFRFAVWEIHLTETALAKLIDLTDNRATIERILQAYLQQHDLTPDTLRIWCDHTPDNFKFYPLLKSVFPDARYIHIVRDGRAVFQSIKKLNWGPNNAYMGSRHWASRIQEALSVEMAEGNNCRRVRYEDILAQPEQQIRELCEFAGLHFTAEMLNGGGLILPDFTRNQHQLVGKAPDASRIDSWRQKLTRKEVEEFEAYPLTRVLMKTFAYSMETDVIKPQSSLKALMRYTHDFVMYLLHRRGHRSMEDRKINS